jgi:hypothetical protein
MKILKAVCVAVAAVSLAGCASEQEKAAEAQKEVAERRLELVDEYQKCVKKAGDDQQKATACESYLKAAESLK